MATFDLSTGNGSGWAKDGTVGIYMWNGFTTYDAVNKKLHNVEVWNTTATAKTLTALNVTFPGNGATKLTTIQNITGTPATRLHLQFSVTGKLSCDTSVIPCGQPGGI